MQRRGPHPCLQGETCVLARSPGIKVHILRQGDLIRAGSSAHAHPREHCAGPAVTPWGFGLASCPSAPPRRSGVKAPGTPPGAEGTEAPRVLPDLQQFYNNQSRLPDGRVVLCFGEEFPDMSPLRSKLILVQIEQLYVRQLVEEAGKTCGASSMVPPPEDPQPDQVFRMFPDICASHQRPFFRENQQITV
uniref:Interferon regulatory factor-3 domain-containing protein n=1 Tax=Ursus maritimus TaxID=29073 RepID=A0A452TPZ3_URSMA